MKVVQIQDANSKTKFGKAISIFKNRFFFFFTFLRAVLSKVHMIFYFHGA